MLPQKIISKHIKERKKKNFLKKQYNFIVSEKIVENIYKI